MDDHHCSYGFLTSVFFYTVEHLSLLKEDDLSHLGDCRFRSICYQLLTHRETNVIVDERAETCPTNFSRKLPGIWKNGSSSLCHSLCP